MRRPATHVGARVRCPPTARGRVAADRPAAGAVDRAAPRPAGGPSSRRGNAPRRLVPRCPPFNRGEGRACASPWTEPTSATPYVPAPHRADIQGLRAVAVLLVVLGHAGVALPARRVRRRRRVLRPVGLPDHRTPSRRGPLARLGIAGRLLRQASASDPPGRRADAARHERRRVLPPELRPGRRTRSRTACTPARSPPTSTSPSGVSTTSPRANRPRRCCTTGRSRSRSSSTSSGLCCCRSSLFGVAAYRRRGATARREAAPCSESCSCSRCASLAYSIWLTSTAPTAAYFSPFTRAWELGLGATVAVCASTLGRIPRSARGRRWAGRDWRRSQRPRSSSPRERRFRVLPALLPTVGAALVIIAGIGGRSPRLAVGRLLAVRPMFMIGDRSYALYLWHWPVLILAGAYAGHELSVPVKLGLVIGAFLLSCVSYAFVENPIRRKVRSRRTTALVVAFCAAALLGTSAVALAGTNRAEQRFEGSAADRRVDCRAQAPATRGDEYGEGRASLRHRRRQGCASWRPDPLGSHACRSASSGRCHASTRLRTSASGTTSARGSRPGSAASATRRARRCSCSWATRTR